MLRRTLLLCVTLTLLGGAPDALAAKASAVADADLAAQAADILSLERVARNADDVQVRDAALRQIDRLEGRARERAADELGRDVFRERAGRGAEGREGSSGGRDVRVFGGREVVRPPLARGGDGRGREGRGNDGPRGDDDDRDGDRGDDDRDDDRDDDDRDDDDRDESTDEQDVFTDDDEMDRSELEAGDDDE